MNKHEGNIRQYTHTKSAWYGASKLAGEKFYDEVMFGYYGSCGGTSGEIAMRWYAVDGKLTPCLECFDDGWHALGACKDVLDAIASLDNENISSRAFCALLRQLGFKDNTERQSPL